MLLNWLNSQRKITLKKGCKKCKILLNYSWLTGQSKIGMEKGRCRPTWSHFRQFLEKFPHERAYTCHPTIQTQYSSLKIPFAFQAQAFLIQDQTQYTSLKISFAFLAQAFSDSNQTQYSSREISFAFLLAQAFF